ncbi:MAG: IreB family regulatory phosphoprotein [Clostridiales bacterium]|nr:IreB family regulatory phosphoprotein [Clostridiales bacterium]
MNETNINETLQFDAVGKEEENKARNILLFVYKALMEKGYNPVNQIVGYILSGDPTYITSHNGARSLIRKLDRDELLEELVADYLAKNIEG